MSNDLQRNISRFIEERSLLQNGDKVIVALSGGADSVELLHVLISLKEKYSFTIYRLWEGAQGLELHMKRTSFPGSKESSFLGNQLCPVL